MTLTLFPFIPKHGAISPNQENTCGADAELCVDKSLHLTNSLAGLWLETNL
jgi:hypothetical protein